MKQTLIILICLIAMIRGVDADTIDVDDRSVLSYEIRNVQMTDSGIAIEGWGMLLESHNFFGEQTHNFQLEFVSEKERFMVPAKLKPISLTSFMAYRGYPKCNVMSKNESTCNYEFNNVGFFALIPYEKFSPDESYTVYLVLNSKVLGDAYRSPLFYPSESNLQKKIGNKNFKVSPSKDHVKLNVFYHTLVVPNGPAHSSKVGILNQRNRCSVSYGGLSYYKEGSIFSNIRKIHQYNNLITYFEVGIDEGNCDGLRWRFSEGSSMIGYLPSNFVNYSGRPLIIDVVADKPKIVAHDRMINQYDDFNPLEGVSAYNSFGQSVKEELKTSHTVNPRIPDKYPLCFSLDNVEKCVVITVREVETTFRYLHPKVFNLEELNLWRRNDSFRTFLERIMNDS
ncbi:MAG: hypothetical protein RR565_04365 [Erysipelothrix sp.]